jgi:RND family efflux transporter MFP subunit
MNVHERDGVWWVLGGSVVSLLLLPCVSCQKEAPPVTAVPPAVTVSQPVSEEVLDYEEFTGRLDASDSVEVRARVSGYLDAVNFEDGKIVQKGDLLFQIDPRPFEAELKAAESQVDVWKAKQAKAQTDVKRFTELLPKGAASQQDLDHSIAEASEAGGNIEGSLAAVDQAKLNLEFTRVSAPITGRVSRALITKGNLVAAGTGHDALLTTIVSVDPIYVYFDVGERSLIRYMDEARKRLPKDAPPQDLKNANIQIQFGLASEEGFPHTAVLDFADNKVNPETGTIQVRGVVDNKDKRFESGLFARVRVPIGEKQKALLVVDRAIGTDQGQKYLLSVKSDNVVEYRPVKLGNLHGSLRVIQEGIGPEDWVIVNGIQRARPGATVNPSRSPMLASKESETSSGTAKPDTKTPDSK